jgi:hypothetical protein
MIEWYLYKAEQCARLAKDAANPGQRSELESEGLLWRELAAQTGAAERNAIAQLQQKSKQ